MMLYGARARQVGRLVARQALGQDCYPKVQPGDLQIPALLLRVQIRACRPAASGGAVSQKTGYAVAESARGYVRQTVTVCAGTNQSRFTNAKRLGRSRKKQRIRIDSVQVDLVGKPD